MSATARPTDRRAATYAAAVRRSFAFLKETTALDDLWAKSVRLADGRGYLVPVCELHAGDDPLVATLARWRAASAAAFPTRFPVTVEGTARWLRAGLLEVEDRLLFLVLDRTGRPVGHLGLAGCLNEERSVEVDNVVRGEADTEPGLMGVALEALLAWAEENVGPERVHLRVLADNERAIRFYRRHGFVDGERQPLRRHEDGDRVSLLPLAEGDAAPADAEFLCLTWAPHRPPAADETILTAGPSITGRETSYALDAVRHGWNGNASGYVTRFQRSFAEYVGVEHALATSSCTGALHLALLALGIGAGDEVVVPDITWVATANAVAYTGATPVFADVEDDSWCLDPAAFEAAITPRTRAVMPVHLYGHPARLDEVVGIARANGLYVVEDAAPAIGAECDGRRTGTFGDIACFSFQGAKLLVTGEGGMLVANDPELFDRALALWELGRDRARGDFWIDQVGWKYRMSNVQAALGLAQIERADEQIEAKRRIFGWYEEGLAGLSGVTLHRETEWARSIYWMTSIRVQPESGTDRDEVRRALRDAAVDTRPVFPTISQYPMWQRRRAPGAVASRIAAEGINLPSGVKLRREQVDHVCRVIRDAVGG